MATKWALFFTAKSSAKVNFVSGWYPADEKEIPGTLTQEPLGHTNFHHPLLDRLLRLIRFSLKQKRIFVCTTCDAMLRIRVRIGFFPCERAVEVRRILYLSR
jgi:hypothetical protein